MKIYLTNQASKFQQHLTFLQSKPVMAYDVSRMKEKVSSIVIPTKVPFENLDLQFLFDY